MNPSRVLVVAPTALARRNLAAAVELVSDVKLIGTAATVEIASAKLVNHEVDVIVVEPGPQLKLPSATRQWMTVRPGLRVVVLDSGRKGDTPSGVVRVSRPEVYDADFAAARLGPAIAPAVRVRVGGTDATPDPMHSAPSAQRGTRIDLVTIGVSTGGPDALADLLPRLPAPLPVPIAIVQHMPASFVAGLAERLTRVSGHRVKVAADGDKLGRGTVVIAPGDRHLTVVEGAPLTVALEDSPPVRSCRPAADVLFTTAATAVGANVLAVVLTGMGNDGLDGSRAVRAAGGWVIAQDEASAVVWGMPGEVVTAGLADCTGDLATLASEIVARVGVGRPLSLIGDGR